MLNQLLLMWTLDGHSMDTRWTLDGHIDGHTQNAAKTEETYQLIENNKKNMFSSFN
jgi:hypothetical protein